MSEALQRAWALKILDVQPSASKAEITKSYRDLVLVWHPDRFPFGSDVRAKAEEKLKDINRAKDILFGSYEHGWIPPSAESDNVRRNSEPHAPPQSHNNPRPPPKPPPKDPPNSPPKESSQTKAKPGTGSNARGSSEEPNISSSQSKAASENFGSKEAKRTEKPRSYQESTHKSRSKAPNLTWLWLVGLALLIVCVGNWSMYETKAKTRRNDIAEKDARIGLGLLDPAFSDIVLTDSESNRTPTTEFKTSTPKFFAFFRVENMPAGSKIKGAWYCDKSAITKEPNVKIDEAAIELPEGVKEANFSLSKPDSGWPAGDFRLDLVYNEQVLKSIKFKIIE